MTQDQITVRLGEILDVLKVDPGHRGVLSTGERVAAAIALGRDEWITAERFESVSRAADFLSPEWAVAAQLHKAGLHPPP